MRFTQILVGALLMFTASFAAAQTNIAVLNVQGVVLSSNQANDFKAQLEREFKPRQDSLKAMAEELKKMQEDGARDADFLSDDQKRELTQRYGSKLREFQKMQNDMAREQQEKEQVFVESVRPKLDAVVNRIVEQRNIDLLLDRRSVLFAKGSALDISQEALDALNASK
ncbi:MAG: OmpH family outer membrane protein [Gammaproteobacteria bacterium]